MEYIKKYFENEIDFDSLNSLFDNNNLKVFLLLRIINNKIMKKEEDKFCLIIGNNKKNNALIISDKLLLKENQLKADLTYFLQEKSLNAKVYLDDKNCITNIILKEDYLQLGVLKDYIIALLPRLLPWYFDNTPTDMLKKMSGIIVKNYTFFDERYNEQLKKSGIWDEVMYEKIKSAYRFKQDQERAFIINEIQRIEAELNILLQNIASKTKTIKKLKCDLTAFDFNDEDITNLIEGLKFSKDNIEIVDVNDNGKITFNITAKMSNFDYDEYENYIKNDNSKSEWLNSSYLPIEFLRRPESLKTLYKHIFETRKLSVYFIVGFTLDIQNGKVNGFKHHNILNGIPHPHLMNNGHLCLGGNANLIAQFIMNGELQETINQLLYSAKQISMSDLMAVDNFIKGIFNYDGNYKGIKLPNGNFVNAIEAIEYIEQHQEEFND